MKSTFTSYNVINGSYIPVRIHPMSTLNILAISNRCRIITTMLWQLAEIKSKLESEGII
jgi:hypothetical protein